MTHSREPIGEPSKDSSPPPLTVQGEQGRVERLAAFLYKRELFGHWEDAPTPEAAEGRKQKRWEQAADQVKAGWRDFAREVLAAATPGEQGTDSEVDWDRVLELATMGHQWGGPINRLGAGRTFIEAGADLKLLGRARAALAAATPPQGGGLEGAARALEEMEYAREAFNAGDQAITAHRLAQAHSRLLALRTALATPVQEGGAEEADDSLAEARVKGVELTWIEAAVLLNEQTDQLPDEMTMGEWVKADESARGKLRSFLPERKGSHDWRCDREPAHPGSHRFGKPLAESVSEEQGERGEGEEFEDELAEAAAAEEDKALAEARVVCTCQRQGVECVHEQKRGRAALTADPTDTEV